jgi:hypothetical protein
MIRVIINLELVYPYSKSIEVLLKFNTLWSCFLLGGGTKKKEAIISMPAKKFKKIFNTNPQIGEYEVPQGASHFISSVNVKEIKVE